MPRYTIIYTLPGERGKEHKKTVDGEQAARKAEQDIRAKGGKVKSFSANYEKR